MAIIDPETPGTGHLVIEGTKTTALSYEPTWPPDCPPGPETLRCRPEIRAAFYTLMNSGPDDDALGEHYADPTEAANRYIQQGIDAAQFYIIEHVDPMRWLARSRQMVWDEDFIGWYSELPLNFLRLSGDDMYSALLDKNGRAWGRQLRHQGRYRRSDRLTRTFYLRDNRIYLARDRRPEQGMRFEYHYRHPFLTTDDCEDECGKIRFDIRDRWLIVAYAGYFAIHDSWPAGGTEMQQKVYENLKFWQKEITQRNRRSRQPKQLRGPVHIGPNMILGQRYV